MKTIVQEFLKILINVFCALILCIGFYNIFINLLHQNHIDERITVSKLDKDYANFANNIIKIENNLNKYKNRATKDYNVTTMNKLYSSTRSCLNTLKSPKGLSGIYEGDKLTPYNIYQLNANFSNDTVNNCWIMGMSFINLKEHNYQGYFKEVFPNYDKMVDILIENTNYVRDDLLDNSSYHYATSVTKDTIRNELLEQYKMVLHNYKNFSDIILEISEFLVKGEYK